ncbi:MAG: hypothetical protein PF588_07660, partial [Candidatus Kapabacteria bacterium]|nr:hypothetical protein [Candidatus Kapabacteria bacterium]
MFKSTIIFVLLLSLNLPAYSFSGKGSGNEIDPFQITDFEQLQECNDDLIAHYILMNDIDASASDTMNSGQGFVPIGTNKSNNMLHAFTGVFDGRGFAVSNLYINRPDENYIGLFGVIYLSALVKDVRVIDCILIGKSNIGGICGKNYSGEISNCSFFGRINGSTYIGGICGWNLNGRIVNSKANCEIVGNSDVGGVCGDHSGEIRSCFAEGTVSGSTYIAGFCGLNFAGSIHDSYSKVNVVGQTWVGGFIGRSEYADVRNCYSVGSVTGNVQVGGFCGQRDLGIMDNCFWDKLTSGFDQSAGASDLSTQEMMKSANFTGWDFEHTWCIAEDKNYPRLQAIEDCDPSSVCYYTAEQNSSVSPNPASNQVCISYQLNEISDIEIEIFNSSGIIQMSSQIQTNAVGSRQFVFTVNELSVGDYFYLISGNRGIIASG